MQNSFKIDHLLILEHMYFRLAFRLRSNEQFEAGKRRKRKEEISVQKSKTPNWMEKLASISENGHRSTTDDI